MYDYSGIITNVVMPKLMDLRFLNPYRQLVSLGTEDTRQYGGSRITLRHQTAQTSNARNYTKADVDPVSDTTEFATAYWSKIYQEASGEAHGIDLSEARNGGLPEIENCLTKAVNDAFDGLWDLIFDDIIAQWKLDITTAGTYSDAALSRSTYARLACYNETTDTTITKSHLTAAQYNVRLYNNGIDPKRYMWLMGPAVNYKLQPQLALQHNWNTQNVNYNPVDGGAAPLATFGGARIEEMNGLTTGDVFYLDRANAIIHQHRPLEQKIVPSGRDSIKVILRCGINGYITDPRRQALLTNKD